MKELRDRFSVQKLGFQEKAGLLMQDLSDDYGSVFAAGLIQSGRDCCRMGGYRVSAAKRRRGGEIDDGERPGRCAATANARDENLCRLGAVLLFAGQFDRPIGRAFAGCHRIQPRYPADTL